MQQATERQKHAARCRMIQAKQLGPTWFCIPALPMARHQLAPGHVPGEPLLSDQAQRGGTWVAVVHH